jgi:hypothetical protein
MALNQGSWVKMSRREITRQGRRSFPFLPGAFFILLGVVVLTAPRLFFAVLAAMFFFVGFVFCYLAWKFLSFKRQLTGLTRELEGKIQVQAFHVRPPDVETSETDSDGKKIVYH